MRGGAGGWTNGGAVSRTRPPRRTVHPMTGVLVPAGVVPYGTHSLWRGPEWADDPEARPRTGGRDGSCCAHRPCCWCLRDVLAWLDGRAP